MMHFKSISFVGVVSVLLVVNSLNAAEPISWSRTAEVGDSYDNSLGMKLVYIPAGSFKMGSPSDERGRTYGETLHKVTLTQPFLIGATEITQVQWEEIMTGISMETLLDRRAKEKEQGRAKSLAEKKREREAGEDSKDTKPPSNETAKERKARQRANGLAKKFPDGKPENKKLPPLTDEQKAERQITLDEIKVLAEQHNIENQQGKGISFGNDYPIGAVTWAEAVEFCKKLTAREHEAGNLPKDWSYRLPTEAEWEYSCRAGTAASVYTGITPQQHERASVLAFNEHAWSQNNAGGKMHPVGQLKANPWGVHDVYGNAIEWCLDIYQKFSEEPQTDPIVVESERMIRTYRGLNGHNAAGAMRSALRRVGGPGYGLYKWFGFRVVCAPIRAETANVPDNHVNR